jgi:hypothetical protein
LIFLDSPDRQSTGFDSQRIEQRHKIAIYQPFRSELSRRREVATPGAQLQKLKFGSKNSPLIFWGFFRCRR